MTLPEFLRLRSSDGLWVFGYGSLMWSPGFRFRERVPAVTHGYHRALCIYSYRYRGTRRKPGLVMGLRPGGSCWGIAYRIAAARAKEVLAKLWRREMRNRVYLPRFLAVRLSRKRLVHALAFIADPAHPQFAGDRGLKGTARLIANSRGERGHNVEYLRRTLVHMHQLGVPDPQLDHVLDLALTLRGSRR